MCGVCVFVRVCMWMNDCCICVCAVVHACMCECVCVSVSFFKKRKKHFKMHAYYTNNLLINQISTQKRSAVTNPLLIDQISNQKKFSLSSTGLTVKILAVHG